MNIITLRLIRIAIFFIAFFLTSKVLLVYLKKRNPDASIKDPEVMAAGVIFSAVITGVVSMLLRLLI